MFKTECNENERKRLQHQNYLINFQKYHNTVKPSGRGRGTWQVYNN